MDAHERSNGAGSAGSPIRPMFLFADSQLLFHRQDGALFLDRVRAEIGQGEGVKASYLGASNGDVPDFYDIFVAAMEGIGVRDTRMIPARPSDADRAYFEESDLVLLAGGDAVRGMLAFEASGLSARLVARYAAGAVLVGISAGAMQLGLRVWREGEARDGLRLAPMVVAAHEEPEWTALGEIVAAMEGGGRGIGIPSGGGAIVHADLSVEPVRRALTEIVMVEGVTRRALLMPE